MISRPRDDGTGRQVRSRALSGPVVIGTAPGRWVLVATVVGSGMVMLDGTVVNVALARIGADLRVGFAGLQWVSNAYTLTLASFILIGGVLGDHYGRRRVFVIGAAWFAASSLLCALSVNEQTLILARALQGVGGALLAPGSLAIISASFARTDRAQAIGTWSGLGGIATAIGPFVGGWLVEFSWRLVFLINVPLAAAVIVIAVRHIPETRSDSATRGVDLPGAAALAVTLGGVTFGLTRAASSGWDVAAATACVGAGLAAVALVLRERRTDHPLVPLSIFRNRVFAATNAVTALVYAALGVYFFLVVLQLQVVSGWSPLAAGTALLPATLVMLLLAARFGALSEQVGPRPLMTLGAMLAAAGFALSTRIGPDASYLSDVLPAVTVLGLGLACTVAPLTAAVLGAVPDELAGAASGANNAVARTAGLLALVVIPAVVGLSGAGLADTNALEGGFRLSMILGAGLLVAAAGVSWFGVGPVPKPTPPVGEELAAPHRRVQCPLNAPSLHPGDVGPARTR